MARKYRVKVRLNSKENQILREYADKFGTTYFEAVKRVIHQLIENCKCSQKRKK